MYSSTSAERMTVGDYLTNFKDHQLSTFRALSETLLVFKDLQGIKKKHFATMINNTNSNMAVAYMCV